MLYPKIVVEELGGAADEDPAVAAMVLAAWGTLIARGDNSCDWLGAVVHGCWAPEHTTAVVNELKREMGACPLPQQADPDWDIAVEFYTKAMCKLRCANRAFERALGYSPDRLDLFIETVTNRTRTVFTQQMRRYAAQFCPLFRG